LSKLEQRLRQLNIGLRRHDRAIRTKRFEIDETRTAGYLFASQAFLQFRDSNTSAPQPGSCELR
jgi:hypothetical protein